MHKSIIVIIVSLISISCINNKDLNNNSRNDYSSFKINLDQQIKKKPYTILYFWASWCGFSQKGLIDDYYANYNYINNDTLQSIFIVMSDTSAINDFMIKNNCIVEYRCMYEKKRSLLTRNIKDSKDLKKIAKDLSYNKTDDLFFPAIFLVNKDISIVERLGDTRSAVRLYRYFEHKKHSK